MSSQSPVFSLRHLVFVGHCSVWVLLCVPAFPCFYVPGSEFSSEFLLFGLLKINTLQLEVSPKCCVWVLPTSSRWLHVTSSISCSTYVQLLSAEVVLVVFGARDEYNQWGLAPPSWPVFIRMSLWSVWTKPDLNCCPHLVNNLKIALLFSPLEWWLV